MSAIIPPQPKLVLDKRVVSLSGMARGLGQPTLRVGILVKDLESIDLGKMEDYMSRWVSKPYSGDITDAETSALKLLARLGYWQAALQLDHGVPIFDRAVIEAVRTDNQSDGGEEFRLFIPYAQLNLTHQVLTWIIGAVNAFLAANRRPDESVLKQLDEGMNPLKSGLRRNAVTGTNILHFLEAAHIGGIPWQHLQGGVYCFGLGANSRWLYSTITDQTSSQSVSFAKSKVATATILAKVCLPAPRHFLVRSEKAAVEAAQRLGYPVVVKPSDQDQGTGVFAGLNSERSLLRAYRAALETSTNLLVEKHQHGEDYRFTVLHGNVIKIMHRKPGQVTGDGRKSVAELVALAQLGENHQRALRRTGKVRLELDDEALDLLEEQELTPESIPHSQQVVVLRRKSNISSGGTHDLVDLATVHPDNLDLAVRAASALGLDIAGIDIIMPDARESWLATSAIICEVNAQPQIGYSGTPDIYRFILGELLQGDGKIPVHLLVAESPEEAGVIARVEELMSEWGCNAVSTSKGFWINGRQQGWNPANSFLSAQAMVLHKEAKAALMVLSPTDVIRYGLPVAEFTSAALAQQEREASDAPGNSNMDGAAHLINTHIKLVKSRLPPTLPGIENTDRDSE